ncbi:MAG: ATP-dependent helicase, partial [Saprospiraceae bacterium]
PLMVIAGAGSGKTRVLTYRIAHLIKNGVDPFNILSLTFTNKAAREMKIRISEIIGDNEARNIWMGTFHSIFARILRIESEKLNYPSNYTIYDTQDSRSVIREVIKTLNIDDKVYKPAQVQYRISSAKNNLISPENYKNNTELTLEDKAGGKPRIAEIYAAYNRKCFRAGAMDFDDLLFNTNVLLKKFPDVLSKYQHKFKYVLVDEYQDTNFSQYLIVKQLVAMHENICVVGDDAQSIYSFRGANIENIFNFRKDYPDYALYKLEQNYRSTQTIVKAANSIIDKNKDQIKKNVWTSNDMGYRIEVTKTLSDNEEGAVVAKSIFENKNNDQAKHSDFCILYRTNAQSRSFEESLRKLNIPYKIYGGLSFYQRKEIKDLLAYFRLTANHNDDESLKRVVNYPARGIGTTTLEKLMISANENDVSLWTIASDPEQYEVKLHGGTLKKLGDFIVKVQSFRAELETKSAHDLGYHIAKSTGILTNLHADKSPEGVARYDNIQELLNGMKQFSDEIDPSDAHKINTMSDFLVDVALLTDADNDDDNKDKVSLMTIHASKGLEFPYVYVVGLEENLFPSQLSVNSRTELEEERRLFYVALTRAEKKAFLSYAETRFKWGNLQYCEPSRFIDDIDPEYIVWNQASKTTKSSGFDFTTERSGYYKKKTSPTPPAAPKLPDNFKKVAKSSSATEDFVASESSLIQAGMDVLHQRFGKGKVLNIEGANPNKKATVFFPSAGQKQLLLKFAKLKIV